MKRPAAASATPEPDALARRAYRAAGHLLLDYLLRQGRAAKFLPMDRALMLPDRRHITLNGDGTNWGERTTATGSLLTVAQVLLAGEAAERLKFPPGEKASASPLVDKARHLLAAYVEQYQSAAEPGDQGGRVERLLGAMQPYVTRLVRKHRRAVEMVAAALMKHRTLETGQAYALVRRGILRGSLLGLLALSWEQLRDRFRQRARAS